MDSQSLRHLQALRNFIRSLVEQAEKSEGCECHRPPSLLLLGPPGAGKTYLVKQMSTVCEMPLFGVHTHHLSGAFALRNLFDNAREIDYPSLLFLDDIDMLFTDQEGELPESPLVQGLRTELFAQLGPRKLKIYDPDSKKNPVQHTLMVPGGCEGQRSVHSPKNKRPTSPLEAGGDSPFPDNSGLIIVAATSAPWLLFKDHELLSRFRGVYLVGLPDKETRFEILKNLLQKIQHNLTDKDLWVVAEKTEGFTPSDLMILTKSLNYKQFEFLFTLARAQASDGSSEEGSISSSDMTESDTESDEELDEDDVIELNKKILMGLRERRALVTPIPGHSSPIKSTHNASSPHQEDVHRDGGESNVKSFKSKFGTNLALMTGDWNSDAEKSKTNSSCRSPLPSIDKKDTETGPERSHYDSCDPRSIRNDVDTSSPDSALGRSKSSEEDIELTKKLSTSMDEPVTPTTDDPCESSWQGETSPKAKLNLNSFICDNSLSAINRNNVSQVDNKMVDRSVEEVEVLMETREFILSPRTKQANNPTANIDGVVESANKENASPAKPNKSEDVREFKLTIHEPPDPVRNDNQAIDSDRDSDNEMGMRASPRNKRVNFSGMAAMEPLTVEVENLDDDRNSSMTPYRNRTPTPPVTVGIPIDETDRSSSSNNNILRSLLSRSASVSYRGDLPLNEALRNKREENSRNYGLGSHGNTDLGLGDDSSERRRSCPDLDRSLFNVYDDMSGLKALLGAAVVVSDKNKTSTPEPMDSLNRTPTSITPTPSITSCQSVASSGSGARVTAASSESDNAKKDSDSSFGRSDSHTNASSDMSTVTCNETGETLECHSDAEERFRNLSEDLSERQQASSASEDEAFDKKKAALYGNLNLDDLGEISIQIITLADVLEAVAATPRSVSDEEIKRYTDFLMWFSKVAGSACPHSKKGGDSSTKSQMDDVSLASTMSCATGHKKRRRPLKKVGRFLLKALMFILD